MRKLLLASTFLLLATARLVAQDCSGRPGWVLDIPDDVKIGSTLTINMTGPANELGLLMFSSASSYMNTPYGGICLQFPLLFTVLFPFDATGHFSISGTVPCDPALVGFEAYSQFITCHPNKGVSNLDELEIEDGLCNGGMATFTQGGWGADCHGGNAGCLRDQNFSTVFPNGLVIGDPDGPDGDSEYALKFTTSAAVNAFLPAGKTPGLLDADATDPTSSSAGVLAGQLVAAKLNLGFDDAGYLDAYKTRPDLKLGDLVFVNCVESHLIGWRVRDVVDFADAIIGGALGAGPYDLDGDGVGDVSISDLNDALDALNSNFDDGKTNNGCIDVQ